MKINTLYLKIFFILAVCIFINADTNGQERVYQTFKDTRVINSHSIETLRAGQLDFRIAHRFGDMFGAAGGWPSFYGLETAADVMIGLEYGINDNFMVGVNRTKGAGDLRQNINSFVKLRFMHQDNGSNPFSLGVVALSTISTMQSSESPGVLSFFEKFAHRVSYHLQLIMASKLSERVSLQVHGAWTYRNQVFAFDQNDLPSIGGAARIQFSKGVGMILDANFPLGSSIEEQDRLASLGIGFEFDTGGGHVFQINFTNSRGLSETDFIPYTNSRWGDGQYRLGFTISRQFNL